MGLDNSSLNFANFSADHTTGGAGGNAYNAYNQTASSAGVFTFNKSVSIPSVWLTTGAGGQATSYGGGGTVVTVKAYADAAGTVLLTNFNFTTAVHADSQVYIWEQCTGLAA